jgi:predicted  nucleic acid-binding Zn ribbon protein
MSTVVALMSREHAFDPQAIQAMSLVLDDICDALRFNGNATAREVIAIRLIELACEGERDSTRLRDLVLADARSGSGC